MNLLPLKPRKALNKAYLKVKPNRSAIEVFKANLIQLIDLTNDTESEEFHKNLVSDFLKKTWYDPNHFINTKGRNDLVIHNGKDAKSTVGVIIEAKKPTNRSEMLKLDNINTKAFHELVLYFLRERITQNNLELKYLVATNINEWFVFDAALFEKLFAQNKDLVKQFNDFEAGRLSGKTTDFFYKEIAEPFLAKILQGFKTLEELTFTYFNLKDYDKPLRNENKQDDNQLISLFKLLSPEHLLKLPFANDSNSLDKKFYSELLHIIGLTEIKEGGKKLIDRSKAGERNSGSLLENAITQLDSLDKISRLEKPSQYGANHQERLFTVGLELCITWINRILFLKLLEAQLITYHRGDKAYSFLNFIKIGNYDDLNTLFFQVLARRQADRDAEIQKEFSIVPYLNSSLFEPTDMEHNTLFISNLRDDKKIPILSGTVLKDENGKKRSGELNALQYLFDFLEAYDFSGEGSEEIQEDNKTLINASVLGLIFEKINGYKDGSFFTPGFITMYMCRETIRRAVVQKFNEAATALEDANASSAPLLRAAGGVSERRTIIPYNPALKELARKLRNESTQSEIVLWNALKGKFEGKYDFHRQKPLNNYIADFYCYELKLVIEIDGATHDWEETQKKDFEKETRLNQLGLNVLRFTDEDVLNHLNSTLNSIRDYIDGFEKGDLSVFKYEDTPLNALTSSEFVVAEHTPNPSQEGNHERFKTINTGQVQCIGNVQERNRERFKTLDDVYEVIGEDGHALFTRQQANAIINSLKICDPAVGSGHFLVSALNEIIAIKNDLKILQDRNGKRLKEYHIEVVNDELIVTDEDGELFEYSAPLSRGAGGVSESQRVQETLFHEKQTIIENCLFGVDINPNSVKICRLRLWIELLKNAYYKSSSPSLQGPAPINNNEELETLPNIDINIKCGNSLISRFDLDADIKTALKKSKWNVETYRSAVDSYRNAKSKEEKREMERLIESIKSDFRSEISKNDPKLKKLYKLSGELTNLTTQQSIFGMSDKEKKDWNKQVEKLTKEQKGLETEIEEIKNNKIYENAFEWRFEFPEVLDDNGDFVGFDVVIGNPPYIRQEEFKEMKKYLSNRFKIFHSLSDLLTYFIELSSNILKKKGAFQFIISGKFTRAGYGEELRKFLSSKTQLTHFIDFGGKQVFDEATVDAAILGLINNSPEIGSHFILKEVQKEDIISTDFYQYLKETSVQYPTSLLGKKNWSFENPKHLEIVRKIENIGTPLKDWDIDINRGVLTGYNEAFVIDDERKNELIKEDPNSKDLIKPLFRGRDIQKYHADKPVNWLIYIPWHFPFHEDEEIQGASLEAEESFEEEYPAIYSWLKKHKEGLANRNKAETGIRYEWYAMQRFGSKYWKDFSKPKIVWKRIGSILRFCYDETGAYCLDSTCIATGKKVKFLCAVLNSKLCNHELFRTSPKTGTGDLIISVQALDPLCVPIPDEEQEKAIIKVFSQILALKKSDPNADISALETEIDRLVYALYELTEEEIEIVEASVK